ncbi:MAG: arsenate reductase [Gemmatimonadota bacterium]|nr:arsenate reductase [Gemmatimonadota bacterium]
MEPTTCRPYLWRMNVQIFGVQNDAATRKALRFFKERRIQVHFNDFKNRAPSAGELRRFVQKFGADAIIDRESKRFKALGLHAAYYGDDRWVEIAAEEPLILRMPLVRNEGKITVGPAEDTWKEWVG